MDIFIEPATEGKGRTFRANLLSYATARGIMDCDRIKVRPIWMMLAGSDSELRPFVANLRMGRKASAHTGYNRRGSETFEILKSANYRIFWQKTEAGAVATLYLPELFCSDPGMVDPEELSFCVLPTADFLVPNPEGLAHLERAMPFMGLNPAKINRREKHFDPSYIADLATVVAAFLDRRTRCPLIPDRRFFAQFLMAALDGGIASLPRSYTHSSEWGCYRHFMVDGSDVGLSKGVLFKASHKQVEDLLAKQVKFFFELCPSRQVSIAA